MPDAATHCRRGRWCPDRTVAYDDHGNRLPDLVGSPYPGPGGLCWMCSRQALAAVHALAGRDLADLADLQLDPVALDRVERDPTMPGQTYRERPIPLDLYGDALARLIVHELTTWQRAIAPGSLSTVTMPRRLPVQAAHAARVLADHWDALLAHHAVSYTTHDGVRVPDGASETWRDRAIHNPLVIRDGGGAALGFLDLHHRVERACGHGGGPPKRHREPCPDCSRTDVLVERTARQQGDPTTVTCEACTWTADGDAWHAYTHPTDTSWIDHLAPTQHPRQITGRTP